jgi:hypothetical protein
MPNNPTHEPGRFIIYTTITIAMGLTLNKTIYILALELGINLFNLA